MRFAHLLVTGSLLALATPALADEGSETKPVDEMANIEAASSDGSDTPLTSETEKKAKTEKKDSGFELRPRWRVQYDVGKISVPDKVNAPGMGWNDILRRAYIGVDAKFGGGISSRIEMELAGDNPEFTDAYVSYDTKNLNLTLGQQKVFQSLDDLCSDLNTSFLERAAFTQAFNFSRRTGLTATYKKDAFVFQAGVTTDSLVQLNDVKDNSLGVDGRVVWAPKMGNTQFHLAGSVHWRDRNDFADVTTRYRARPYVRTTDTRFVSTPQLYVDQELSYGVEAAAVKGRFHVTGEGHWMRPSVIDGSNPTLWGGYAEAGFFLTDDSRPYKAGSWGTIKPKTPFGEGGIGAVQVNARYDYLDLNSSGYTGGKQSAIIGGLTWIPIENVRLSGNYARLKFKDARIAATDGDRNYSGDAILFRVQVHY